MPQGSILGANIIQPRICHFCRAEQKGSSGVRHRKWKLLGVKIPDFTVGMSSHCIIRGYSPSASASKRSGKTAASLPERRYAEVTPHHVIHLSLPSQFLRNVTSTFNLTTAATYFTLCAHPETSKKTSRS